MSTWGPPASASRTALLTHKRSPTRPAAIRLGSAPQDLADAEVKIEPGDRLDVSRAGLVYVLGDVGRPGGYLIENRDAISVLQALALAQGVNKTARLDAKLIRTTDKGRVQTELPLKKILSNQADDPRLQDGDILFVPLSGPKHWADRGVTSVLQMAVGVVIYGRL